MVMGGGGGTEVARFYATLGADTSGFESGVGRATSTWGRFTGSIMQGVGLGAGFGLITMGVRALTAALGDAAQGTISYETAFTGITKTVNASAEEFAQLDRNIRKLATSGPVGRDELAGIGQIAGQLGVRGVDNITRFVDTVAKISTATNLSSEAAATGFARFANVMGTPIDRVDELASGVVGLGNNFATTESEILEFGSRISGAGKIVGLTEAQVFSMGAALASIGVEAEAGGTAASQALLTFNETVAKGGDELKLIAMVSGMTAKQFGDAWAKDAFGAFVAFERGLGTLGPQASMVLDEIGLGGVRTGRSLLGLSQNTDLLTRAEATYITSAKGANALTEEYGKFAATTASQTKQFTNEVRELSDVIGRGLVGALNLALPLMTELTKEARLFITGQDGISRAFNDAAGAAYRFLYPAGASQGPGIGKATLDRLSGQGPDTIPWDALRNRGMASLGAGSSIGGLDPTSLDGALGGIAPAAKEAGAAASGMTDEIKALLAAMDDGAHKMSDAERAEKALAEARKQAAEHVEDVMTRRLVEAYITGGDAQVEIVRTQNEAMLAEFTKSLDTYKALGLEIPNTAIDMFLTIKDAGKKALAELMGTAWRNVGGGPGNALAIAAALNNPGQSFSSTDFKADGTYTRTGPASAITTATGPGASINVTNNFTGIVGDPAATGKAVADAVNAAARENGAVLNAGAVMP